MLEGLRGCAGPCAGLQAMSRDRTRDKTSGAQASLVLKGELVWWRKDRGASPRGSQGRTCVCGGGGQGGALPLCVRGAAFWLQGSPLSAMWRLPKGELSGNNQSWDKVCRDRVNHPGGGCRLERMVWGPALNASHLCLWCS